MYRFNSQNGSASVVNMLLAKLADDISALQKLCTERDSVIYLNVKKKEED